jgi:hypothetical protein
MVVLRALAGHFVERLAPTGMLLTAATLTGTGLFLLSFAQGTLAAFAAATVFAWGVAFFFPTMVGVVSERVPRTGSLGIVLTAGIGLGMSGAVGVPLMGRLADRYLAESLPTSTLGVLQRVDQQFPAHVLRPGHVGPDRAGVPGACGGRSPGGHADGVGRQRLYREHPQRRNRKRVARRCGHCDSR